VKDPAFFAADKKMLLRGLEKAFSFSSTEKVIVMEHNRDSKDFIGKTSKLSTEKRKLFSWDEISDVLGKKFKIMRRCLVQGFTDLQRNMIFTIERKET
jgi:hypothetical protein